MADHPNAARYREVGEAFAAGDFGPMMDSIADDVEWWYIGGKEPLRGKQAMMEMMGSSDSEITFDLHDVVANDEH